MATWAAIFDWDGVVVDSSSRHAESWDRLAAVEGRVLPAGHFQRSFGMRNEQIIPDILGWATDPEEVRRLARRKESIYRDIVRERGIPLIPGIDGFLRGLQAAGIPCAVASSTSLENLRCVFPHHDLESFFAAFVTAEMVARGKPDPEVFHTAAARLGMDPARCAVFEDSHAGLAAARAAGGRVVALSTTNPADSLHPADIVAADFREIPVDRVAALFAL
jgi:HAD superfamily hydrolase (TIGR01509 family)